MKCAVVGSGHVSDLSLFKKRLLNSELIICADGGARHLIKCGIEPHILLGDFDSIEGTHLKLFRENGVEVKKYPKEKDMTDMELAAWLAADKGADEIWLLGASGSRLDHTLSNIFFLKRLAQKGIMPVLADDNNEIYVVMDSIRLKKEDDVRLSLLSLSEKTEGISSKGLYYPLSDAVLEFGTSMGVSNEFTADEAEISIKNGILLCLKSRD